MQGQLLLLLLLSIAAMASCWSHEQCELIAAIKRSNESHVVHASSSVKVDDANAAQVAQQWLQQQQAPFSFLLPAVDSLNEKMVKLLMRGKSKFVSTSVGKVHVIDANGKGALPPAILLHGITSRAADFAPLMSRLLKDCRRVIAIDMPGTQTSFVLKKHELMHRFSTNNGAYYSYHWRAPCQQQRCTAK
jgi:pimeloyl-ACP methyl ester carboxylesterase